MKQQTLQRALLILLFLVSATLSFAQLGQTAFWDDESQVAIVGRNFVNTGHLTAWDGRNLFAYQNGVLLDPTLRPINPPLDYLVTAASFRLFGMSTWTARLPFVLFGLASLVLFYGVLRECFPEHYWLRFYALGLCALSVVFLLNIRNCRYYALALFFSQLALFAYRRSLKSPHWGNFLLLCVGAALLFYSNFLLGAAFLLALGITHLLWQRTAWDRAAYTKLGVIIVVFCLAVGPYALHYHIWQRSDFKLQSTSYIAKFALFWENFHNFNEMGCLPWLAQIGLIIFVRLYRGDAKIQRATYEMACLAFLYTGILSALLPQPPTPELHTFPDMRYLIPAVPLCFVLVAVLVWAIGSRIPILGAALFCILVSCNVLSLNALNRTFHWFLPAYVSEVTHPYPTANAAASQYLLAHAKQDDLVLADPEYLNYPIMFYAGSKVKLCGLMDRKMLPPTLRPALEKLNAPIFKDQANPDWIVSFGQDQFWLGNQQDTKALLASYSRSGAHYHLAATLNVNWNQTQRPEISWHHFGPVTNFDPKTEAVYIYQRDITQVRTNTR